MSSALTLVQGQPINHPHFHGMVGTHPLMLDLFSQIQGAAGLEAPVVIHGETGTGKELVAQALGKLSSANGKVVAINLAEISETLVEATLFGSVRGAFTGAVDQRGLLEEASGGVLCLDEAGELPRTIQLKLLRALETRVVRRLGSLQERPARFRLLLCVQGPPAEMVASGRWRPDFRYRADGILLTIPALRDRATDIPELIDHFLVRFGQAPIRRRELEPLIAYSWPGNVRELIRVLERAVWVAGNGKVEPEHLIAQLTPASALPWDIGRRDVASAGAPGQTLREMERQYIEQVLREKENDVRASAKSLGLTLSALYRRFRSLAITPPRHR